MSRVCPVFREAAMADAEAVAAGAAEADAVEVAAASGGLPLAEALRQSLRAGPAWCASIGGRAECLFGVAPGPTLLSRDAVVWAVATARAHALAVVFWRWSRPALALAAAGAGPGVERLVNAVWVGNGASARWLRRLGAAFGPPFAAGGLHWLPFEIAAEGGQLCAMRR